MTPEAAAVIKLVAVFGVVQIITHMVRTQVNSSVSSAIPVTSIGTMREKGRKMTRGRDTDR